jgi:NTP pyrophosphatase (non-canonical NTP hydrolase)
MKEQTGMDLVLLMDLKDRHVRQRAIGVWTREAFGADHAYSLPHRGLRLLEEAIELAQAVGCDLKQCHNLLDYVFARPKGDIAQEMGGVGVTLLALGEATSISVEVAERTEVDRVLRKPLDHFRRRNAEKDAAGFSAAGGR